MAQEPGGGSGVPYSRFEDLNYAPGYSIQDWLRNMMLQGNIGAAPPMGVGTPDFLQEEMRGRMPPSDRELPPRSQGPQDFIRQQLAGDVVPMYPGGSQQETDAVRRLLQQPRGGMGSMGQLGIQQFGGRQNPYLDLMDVLQYPYLMRPK
jgi:hypothetical protein